VVLDNVTQTSLLPDVWRKGQASRRLVYLANIRSIFTIRWANFFGSRGWDVHVITWRALGSAVAVGPNVHVWRIMSPPHYAFLWTALPEVLWRLRTLRPDIVHGHYLHTFGMIAGLCTYVYRDCPVAVSGWGPHGLLHCGQPLRWLIRVAVSRADAVTVSTTHLRDILKSGYDVPSGNLHCFPWGIDVTVFYARSGEALQQFCDVLGIPSGASVIFSPRTAAPHYRIDRIVRAVRRVYDNGYAVYLVVATGAGVDLNYLSILRKLIRELCVQDAVLIIEREMTPEEMASLYSRAASTVCIPWDDQFGASVLEAMACGSVPIVSRVPAYQQYLRDGDNALFVNGDHTDDLAEAIARAVNDTELQQRCATTNPTIIRGHEDFNYNALQMERLYMELIGARHRQT